MGTSLDYEYSELMKKLKILADSAKYDASCASSGSTYRREGATFGTPNEAGICHTWSADGRCVSLFKILLGNTCAYDCAYCINRRSNDVPRAVFTPAEVAELTAQFYTRNYIEGLFLSSAVLVNPDFTMELMLKTLEILRHDYHFGGYIHIKVIPGASSELIFRAGFLADRVSVNLELPTRGSLSLLAPQKPARAILGSMGYIGALAKESGGKAMIPAPGRRKKERFAPAGQSTQLIVGATPEPDSTILRLSEGLYRKYALKRVYYSAYLPVGNDLVLPGRRVKPPLKREHRIYQADWLMRYYHFRAAEIIGDGENLDTELDPKCAWALRHLDFFPVEVNRADYETLLRVPGIGVVSARRIIRARRLGSIGIHELASMGIVMKRAKYFVCARGKLAAGANPFQEGLRDLLRDGPMDQLSIFDAAAQPDHSAAKRQTAPEEQALAERAERERAAAALTLLAKKQNTAKVRPAQRPDRLSSPRPNAAPVPIAANAASSAPHPRGMRARQQAAPEQASFFTGPAGQDTLGFTTGKGGWRDDDRL